MDRYWAPVKSELKSTKKVSQNTEDFKRIYAHCSKKVTEEAMKSLTEGLLKMVHNFIISGYNYKSYIFLWSVINYKLNIKRMKTLR